MSHIKILRQWVSGNLLLWFIMALAGVIRFYHSFHVLLTDEVFNLITIETLADGNGFTEYFFRHPPLYILLSSYISSIVGNYPQLPSFLSIMFSVLSFIPFYLIASLIMGKRVALVGTLFLAIMPANIYYSTWIKQDAMLLFFFLCGLYFYLMKRYWLSGIAIGVALLVKEFAFFFFPLSFFLTFFSREKQLKRWYGWLKTVMISCALSVWWYIIFGIQFYKVTAEALTGENIREVIWHFPWWFYIGNSPYDLSFAIFTFFIIGIGFLVKEMHINGLSGGHSLPLLWIIIFHLPLSLMTVKAPWYIYLATPPLAMVSAFGMIGLMDSLRSKGVRILTCSVSMIWLALLCYKFNPTGYFEVLTGFSRPQIGREAQGSTWSEMSRRKEFWSTETKGVERVAFLGFHPILQYLTGIPKDNLVILKSGSFIGLDREGLRELTEDYGIGVYVVNIGSLTYTERNLNNMRVLWGDPIVDNNFMFFVTRNRG